MPPGFEIIKARTKDDAAVIIDRLIRSKQQEVVLFLPKNSIVTTDLNSLKILKEEALNIGKTLLIDTENNEIKLFAKKIKMSLYNNSEHNDAKTKEVKKIRMIMDVLPPLSNKAPEETTEETEEIPLLLDQDSDRNVGDLEKNIENFYNSELPEISTVAQSELKSARHYPYLNHVISFFVIIGILLFGAAMYLILPKADVKISLNEVPLKVQIPIAVSKNAISPNLSGGIIPGQYFSLSKTGSKIIEGRPKISGIIEIFNAYSVAPQKLIAQTRFETKDGKIFRIQTTITVPGAKMSGATLIPSSIKTKVVADSSAGEYLIGSSFFTISGFKGTPKYAGFYAKSAESMVVSESAFVSKEELEKNKNELKDRLAQELKSDTLSTLKDSNLQLISGAALTKIDDFNVNENTLSMKITWQALFFKEKDFRAIINYYISSHYQDLKDFNLEGNIAYPEVSRADFKKGELFFTFNIDKSNALPADLGALKKELAGHDEAGMRAIISEKKYVNNAAISLWPFWASHAPNNLKRIDITIDN